MLTKEESANKLRELLRVVVAELVDQPTEVSVITTLGDNSSTIVLTIKTAKDDVGKVIGRSGGTFKALTHLAEAVAAKYRQRVVLEVANAQRRESYGWER